MYWLMEFVKFTPNELDAVKPLEKWAPSYRMEGQTHGGGIPFASTASPSHREKMGIRPHQPSSTCQNPRV